MLSRGDQTKRLTTRRKLRWGSAIAIAIGIVVQSYAALADDWDNVVSAAQREGQVILYSAQPPDVTEQLVKLFNAKYPAIHVTVVNDSATALATRYEAERKDTSRSPADVLEGSAFGRLANQYPDWFQDLSDAKDNLFPNLADYPASVKSAKSIMSSAYSWSLVYNTDELKATDLPKSWKDLADPKWKGKGVMIDPRTSAAYMSWFVFERQKLGDGFIRALGANGFILSNGGIPASQAVAAGQAKFAFPVARGQSASLRANGAPLGHADLKPLQVNTTITAFPVTAPNPHAALVLGNFMLTAESQQFYCDAGQLASFSTKAAGGCTALKMPAEMPIANLDAPTAQRDAIVRLLGLK